MFPTDHKNLQQDHGSSIANVLMIVAVVTETSTKTSSTSISSAVIYQQFIFITSNILMKIITAITSPAAPTTLNQLASFKQQHEEDYHVILFQVNVVKCTDLEKVVLAWLFIFSLMEITSFFISSQQILVNSKMERHV